MIIGAHSVIHSKNPDADLAHPAGGDDGQQFFLMCDDVKAFVADMAKRGIACTPAQDQGWGVLTELTLPGGGKLGVYQPRHKRPPSR